MELNVILNNRLVLIFFVNCFKYWISGDSVIDPSAAFHTTGHTHSAGKHFLCFQVTTIPVIFLLFGPTFYSTLKFPLHLSNNCWMLKYPRLNPCISFVSSLIPFHPVSIITHVSQYGLNFSPMPSGPTTQHISTRMSKRHFSLPYSKLTSSSLSSLQTCSSHVC